MLPLLVLSCCVALSNGLRVPSMSLQAQSMAADASWGRAKRESRLTLVKKGDGENIPREGDTVALRIKGVLQQPNMHDTKYHDSVYEFQHPYQVSELGSAERMAMSLYNGVDLHVVRQVIDANLPNMSLGEINNLNIDTGGKDGSADFEVELLKINGKGTSVDYFENHMQLLSTSEPVRTNVFSLKNGPGTMTFSTIEAGDGKTFAQKGDTVTFRTWGIAKVAHFQDSRHSDITSWQYPMQEKPATLFGMEVGHGWDQDAIPGMSLGESKIVDMEVTPPFGKPITDSFHIQLIKIDPPAK